MPIRGIWATRDEIVLDTGDFSGSARVYECAPVPGGRTLSCVDALSENGEMRLPRFEGGRDRVASRFEAGLGGACYVCDFAPGASECEYPYPQPACIKALDGTPEDIRALGLRQTLININLPAIMALKPKEETIDFDADGHTYHFIKRKIDEIDRHMRLMDENGLLTTMILLNSPRLFGSTGEKALLDRVIHPKFEWGAPDAFLSAFNMEDEEGQGFFRAFVEFLAARYSRPDRLYGRALGMIISNEVDTQCVWGNAGEMDVNSYTHEYACACRLAWLLSRKHYANFRVYISLDQYFCGARHKPLEPLHSYAGRDVIDCMNAHCLREGNFGWNVAYHPYPEDLRYPDFWNDRAPDFTFSTPKITFKNMEVLEAYLSKPELLYKGAPRRIIFSEQGFNSQSGALQALTEKQAAAAYCLAYLKARAMPTCDMFTHHAYRDNPHEFGLNLGIRRYDSAAPDGLGAPKPIYESVRDMDTPREAERVRISRAFIGAELFDYLLHPPLVYADASDASGTDFGN